MNKLNVPLHMNWTWSITTFLFIYLFFNLLCLSKIERCNSLKRWSFIEKNSFQLDQDMVDTFHKTMFWNWFHNLVFFNIYHRAFHAQCIPDAETSIEVDLESPQHDESEKTWCNQAA